MIIVCVGDSFTAGAELWEEQNIPDYSLMSFRDAEKNTGNLIIDSTNKELQYNSIYSKLINEAIMMNNFNLEFIDKISTLKKEINWVTMKDIDNANHELAYPTAISNLLGCKVFNLGWSGGSGLCIIANAIAKISKIKLNFPTDSMICIFQHTSPERVWLEYMGENTNFVLSEIERNTVIDPTVGYEIKNIYMKYIPKESMDIEYFMQVSAFRKFCMMNNIEFLHFRTTNFDYGNMSFNDFFKNTKYIDYVMVDKLTHYYGNSHFILPKNHYNIASHKLMGQWLVEWMWAADIIPPTCTPVKKY